MLTPTHVLLAEVPRRLNVAPAPHFFAKPLGKPLGLYLGVLMTRKQVLLNVEGWGCAHRRQLRARRTCR